MPGLSFPLLYKNCNHGGISLSIVYLLILVKMILTKEKDSLSLTVTKLTRDLAKVRISIY